MLELTGCIPLDRIDYIHLNGLDSSTITVFKCQKKKLWEIIEECLIKATAQTERASSWAFIV